ncbi:MAG: FAD:protein FMN transferase [Chloroflexi bacterium]|nr:FAD:protein FMN transferase [Chloroflexota bacterium]
MGVTRAPRTPVSEALPISILGEVLAKRRFRAMNTDVELTLLDWSRAALLDRVERFVHEFEGRFSRFRPDSELCALNARAGATVPVSDQMLDLLATALTMHRETNGLFEPAILPTLEAAGYDRSFERVSREGAAARFESDSRGTIAAITIDARRHTVTAPEGLRLDLGGIGKGYCVDRAAELLRDAGPALINAGGDMFGRGGGLDGHGWVIEVLDPADTARAIDSVRLYDRAIATSTTAVRNWRRGDRAMHHLIDPRTGAPAESGVCSATVIADTAARADVFAKTALLLGPHAGSRFLDDHGAHGLFVLADASVHTTDAWPSITGR